MRELLEERARTHGDFKLTAAYAQELRNVLQCAAAWESLECYQREALEQIMLKIARILSGKSDFADHWNDIAGYAKLGAGDDL